ncbi:hypothetical protein D9758_006592 [Tetrapyrgos nigripes]|uniref:chitin synthase n=1 Tax=Tetrapyrgos nigripes TaxID=182062 RepID=A0A8H5LQS0_9AGAR|nr:hypothetical protein D9758_006592 [Tetrapyrgos nigripes]
MTVSAFLLAFEGMDQIIDDQGIDAGDLFDNTIFRNIVLSLVATLGLYLVASLIFFEPWHMITSFFRYMLVAPSYISVLNVYAFVNVHNVSWNQGRQQSVVDATNSKNGRSVDAAVPDQPIDIDANYEDALHVLGTKAPKLEGKVDAATQQDDYYRTVRTNVLLAWTLGNGLLATAVASATEEYCGVGFFFGQKETPRIGTDWAFTMYMIIRLFAGEYSKTWHVRVNVEGGGGKAWVRVKSRGG